MDDGTVVGSLKDITTVVDILTEDGPSKGLHLNQSKSSIWVGEHFEDTPDPTGRGIPKADSRGIQLLGSPIRTNAFMLEVVENASRRLKIALSESCLPSKIPKSSSVC